MASLGEVFDPTQVAPSQPGTSNKGPVPRGHYSVAIVNSDVARNNKNTGDLIKLTFEINDGEHAGIWIYCDINWTNPNQIAQRKGRETFSAICHACGYLNGVSDTTQLHNIPLGASVELIPASGKYKAKNEITQFLTMDKLSQKLTQPQAPAQQAAPAQQQAPVQQAPAQQAPTQQAPIQQAPVQQQASVQQAPVQQPVAPPPARTNGAADASWR